MQIKADAYGYTSTALVISDPLASATAIDGEDADVLLMDKAKTPFTIYTAASGRALAINRTCPCTKEAIPIAFYSPYTIEAVELSFHGHPAYVEEWDLFDSKTKKRTPLTSGYSVSLQLATDGSVRYFLEHNRCVTKEEDLESIGFKTYTEPGWVTIFSDEEMAELRIYDVAGRLLMQESHPGSLLRVSLPAGVYTVTANGQTAKVLVP